MRPVRRGVSPRADDFADYREALPFLISRLGAYCSYCERRMPTNLAVEHIQPKDPALYPHLIGHWDNYLLGCVNCNSTKLNKDVVLNDVFLPDRDNTFFAFSYTADGKVSPSHNLNPAQVRIAKRTLSLTGLDKKINEILDENSKLVSIDRVSQRMEVWAIAEDAAKDVAGDPCNQVLKKWVVQSAISVGFFSIWMAVFQALPDMRSRFIDAFGSTRDSGCFDVNSTDAISPAPNPDGLLNGSKV